jgi:hypothetical protein
MKRSRYISAAIWMVTCLVLSGGNADAERAIRVESRYDGSKLHEEYSTGTNYALVIGINSYRNHRGLRTAVNDAEALASLLEKKYFFEPGNIILLKDQDATKARIMQEFRDLVATKVKKGDNVFIYYAGHGWFDDILEAGYWVTAEATKSPASFLENNTVYKFIAALDKKGVQHVFLVSDSCFSGSFTKDHRAIETAIDDRYFRKKYGKPSRNVLTSGGVEPVADEGKEGHSVFAYYFLKTLKENPYPYLSGKQVGVQVEELVTRNSTQTPISKFIHGVGDEGGQFFFINKKSGEQEPRPGPVKLETVDLPSKGGASFDDILKAEKEQQKAVERWEAWQESRNREYAQVQEIDNSKYLKPEQKAAAWERYLTSVSDDNPFSTSDDEMRAKAKERARYWKEYKVASVPSTPKKAASPAPSSSDEIGRDGVYVAYANGIVKDTRTGLEWVAGPDKDTNWDEAKSWVEGLNLGGGGWRMPTMDELEGVYKNGAGSRNMTPLLKTSGWWVWSGETKGSSNAWLFDFLDGSRYWIVRNFSYGRRAFAVRSRSDG